MLTTSKFDQTQGEIPIREREDAMASYLMMFAAAAVGLPLPSINLIAAIIYYYTNRNKSSFVRFHIIQSLYSQIGTSVMNIILVFWTIRIFFFKSLEFTDVFKGYLAVTLLANLLYFIFSIIAAVKARQGKLYFFLVFGKLAYQRVYVNGSGNEIE